MLTFRLERNISVKWIPKRLDADEKHSKGWSYSGFPSSEKFPIQKSASVFLNGQEVIIINFLNMDRTIRSGKPTGI